MIAHRLSRISGTLLLVVMLAALAGACSENGDAGAGTGGGADRLVVTRDDGAGGERRERFACDAAPGLCAEVRTILAEPEDEACTQVYGGPERIRVAGTLDGAEVDLLVTREDGCEIDRYDRLTVALERAGG